jgi:hypothetical protein
MVLPVNGMKQLTHAEGDNEGKQEEKKIKCLCLVQYCSPLHPCCAKIINNHLLYNLQIKLF